MTYLRILSVLALSVALTAGASATSQKAPSGDIDGDGIPDAAEAVLGTDSRTADTDGDGINDKDDAKPLEVADPISPSGKPGGPTIRSIKVEDNYDPRIKRDAPDHLEISIRNPGSAEIKGLQVFYTIKDNKSGATESYFRKLTGFSIKPGATRALHFDLTGASDLSATTDHFRANENSMYYKTPSAKTVEVIIAAEGYTPSKASVQKDEGGAEEID